MFLKLFKILTFEFSNSTSKLNQYTSNFALEEAVVDGDLLTLVKSAIFLAPVAALLAAMAFCRSTISSAESLSLSSEVVPSSRSSTLSLSKQIIAVDVFF